MQQIHLRSIKMFQGQIEAKMDLSVELVLAQSMNSRFHERSCLKKCGKQSRKIPDVHFLTYAYLQVYPHEHVHTSLDPLPHVSFPVIVKRGDLGQVKFHIHPGSRLFLSCGSALFYIAMMSPKIH